MKTLLACLLLSVVACQGTDDIHVRHMTVPGYPRLARMARLQGSVRVDVEVAADGAVISARASGAHQLLRRASVDNSRQWTFCPLPAGGESTTRHTVITYIYRLEGREEYYDPPPTVILDLPGRVEIISHPPEPQP